ncbi:MAG TPA: NB-ARC domain-containing protein [Ktedonosporobacter sp.]|nr:NB-ARC domain-containing protein [Ktedonosporobacter sp.]
MQRQRRFSSLQVVVASLIILATVVIVGIAVFIVRVQGVAQGLNTLTILSIVLGIVLGMLTLMLNFFQWHASLDRPHHPALPEPHIPVIPAPNISSQPLTPALVFAEDTTAVITAVLPDLANDTDQLRIDWGEAPNIEQFYGRAQELEELKGWIEQDHCQVVAILGMSGVGKTTLASTLAQQISTDFKYVFWRSLQNAPSPESILTRSILFLSDQQQQNIPDEIDRQIALLIDCLRKHRCLLVLDNLESVLQSEKQAGYYLDGYEGFGRIIEQLGTARHRSCLLLTSREKPRELARLEGKAGQVRSIFLTGLAQEEAQRILQDEELFATPDIWNNFISLYSGNPLALKLVSEPIRELFRGDIAAFLAEGEALTGDIRELLDRQFQRLPALEQEIMYWLAIEREAISLSELHENIVHPIAKGDLLEALKSLRRRSMVETSSAASFALQPLIMEYVTARLVKGMAEEIDQGAPILLHSHALLKAQARDYVRHSQQQFLLAPLAAALLSRQGKQKSEQQLQSLLTRLPKTGMQASYAAGNILNLLIQLESNLQGYDFSHLMIQQASLQGVTLPDVNFSYAEFAKCIFTETFGNILSVAFSPDMQLLAAGTANGEVELWQLPDGTPLQTLQGHTDWVRSVVFSPDGQMIASGSDDQTVRLWEIATGHYLKTFAGKKGRIYAVTFSPDGRTIATGGDDQAISLWEVASGHRLRVLRHHHNRIRSIAFSPDGKLIASSSDDQQVNLWDAHTGEHLNTLQNRCGQVYSIAFSADGCILATGSSDQQIRLWEIATGHCRNTLQGHRGNIQSIAFSSVNSLISGSDDQTVRLWDTATGHCLNTLQGHNSRIRSVASGHDGQTIASGSDDQTVRLWDARTAQQLKTLQGHSYWIYSAAFSPDGSTIVSGSDDRNIHLWDAHTGKALKTLRGHNGWIYTVAWSPDGQMLASGSDDRTIRLWDAFSGQGLKTLRGHTGRIRAIAFHPGEHILMSGGDDQTVRCWETTTGQCLRVLQGHTDRIRTVALSSDGALLASGGEDQSIRLWQTSTGRCLRTFEGHVGRIWSVAFSPRNGLLASGGDDQRVHLWDTQSGRHFSALEGHTGRIYSIVFSPDGTSMASGSEDQTIHIWDVDSRQCLKILEGHSSRIRSVAFNPDGTMLVSGSHDGTIKLWNLQTGVCQQTLRSDRPYERMNITGAKGLTPAQKTNLLMLGAIEAEITTS